MSKLLDEVLGGLSHEERERLAEALCERFGIPITAKQPSMRRTASRAASTLAYRYRGQRSTPSSTRWLSRSMRRVICHSRSWREPLIWPMQCGVASHEATECHIYNVAFNILGLILFVLIELDIVAALENQQLLRKTRALLVRRGEGNVSCGCRTAVRRAGRYREGVGTNLRDLRRSAAARPKGGDANCQS